MQEIQSPAQKIASMQDIEVVRCSISAFHEEHNGSLKKAQSLHEAAVIGLKAIAEDPWHNQETRTICDKQAEFHANRYHLIRSMSDEGQDCLPFILPTMLSAGDSINGLILDGGIYFGLEESLHPGYLANKTGQTGQMGLAAPIELQDSMHPATFPPKQYTIAVEIDSVNYTHWLNAHPVNQPDQTCYRLRANRWGKAQFESLQFYRATEFVRPCIDINVASVASTGDKKLSAMKGRSIEYIASNGAVSAVESPNHVGTRSWDSQRFTYGGRKFVWVTPEGGSGVQLPILYEQEGDNREGKNGKKLCWGDLKPGKKASATITIPRRIDQLFEELLLASQMAKMAIILFGHDI